MKTSPTLIGLTAFLFLSGCSREQAEPAAKSEQTEQQRLVGVAKEAVLSKLRDPHSAEFREVNANAQNVVCGSVNAKNGFGGYVGYSAFWYDPKTGEAFLYDPDQNWRDKGYDARLFRKMGCSIGSEEAKALEVARALDESDRRLKEMSEQ
jgi:hypothetical protein